MPYGELLAPCSATDTAGNWQTTSSPGVSLLEIPGGVKIMALTATLGLKENWTILSYDGAYAFHNINRHKFLPVQDEIIP